MQSEQNYIVESVSDTAVILRAHQGQEKVIILRTSDGKAASLPITEFEVGTLMLVTVRKGTPQVHPPYRRVTQ